MSIFPVFKIFLTYFLDFVWVFSGRILGIFSKKTYRIEDFDEIRINRADRLWDAIISRPFLAIFARTVFKYAKAHNRKPPVIRVIASAYNIDFLKPLESDGILVEAASWVTTYDYDRSIVYALKKLIIGFVSASSRLFHGGRSRIAFVDLVDSVTEWVESTFPGREEAVWISSNRGPYSLFFDFNFSDRFSGSTKRNLVETYILLFSKVFSLPNLRDEVMASMDEFYSLNRQKIDKNAPILCLVWVKEFRNFSTLLWHKIICAFALQNPAKRVEVIDAPDGLVRKELEKLSFPENVSLIDNPHPKSLSDFANWASSRYDFVFGVDGGWINALRPYMNTCVAYTLGNYRVWSAFTWDTKTSSFELGDGWKLLCAEVSPGLTQSWIFKEAFFLPSFQIPVGKKVFDDLDENKFANLLKSL